jgi:hypothetical protein
MQHHDPTAIPIIVITIEAIAVLTAVLANVVAARGHNPLAAKQEVLR